MEALLVRQELVKNVYVVWNGTNDAPGGKYLTTEDQPIQPRPVRKPKVGAVVGEKGQR